MRRAVFTALIALLALDASAAAEFLIPEPCAAVESGPCETDCPPTCVRCSCCAQPLLQVSLTDDAPVRHLVVAPPAIASDLVEDAEGRDIAHVPKTPAL